MTKTLNFPLNGNSSTTIFDKSFECCHISFSIDPFGSFDGDISADVNLKLDASLSAPSHNDLSFTDTNLRQGRTLDLTNTFTNDSASLGVNYTLGYAFNLYGFDFTGSKSEGDSLSCGLPLLTNTCSHTKDITLFSFTLIDVGVAWFDINVLMPVTTTAHLSGNGVTSHRTLTVDTADVVPPADLAFTSSPLALDESTRLSCSLPANSVVNYAMGDASSSVGGTVDEGVGIGVNGSVFIPTPVPPDFKADIYDTPPIEIPDLISLPAVQLNALSLTAPGQNADLGTLLPNNIAPTVVMDTIPVEGTEGSPIQLRVKGTGAGGSLSPCGDDSLNIEWSFDDGGTAFGKTINHVFADNYLGSALRTGKVKITDPTGLSTTLNFSVPVGNVAPTVSAGPDKTAYWGTLVHLHGNGSDVGSVDNASLLYAWNFGDPDSLVGGVGQDVAHSYSTPGSRTAMVTVTDNDGATGTSSVAISIIKRGSTTGYTGPTTFDVTDAATLRASLGDNVSSGPVANRTVNFYDGTTLIASGTTDNSGVATATYVFAAGTVGSHTITAKFAGDGFYTSSDSTATQATVTRNTSVLTYTGVLISGPSKPVTLTAKLTDDLGRPLGGKAVSFSLGTQGCSGTTIANGTVSCTIAKLIQNPGKYAFAVQFAGDTNYTAAGVNAVFTIGK